MFGKAEASATNRAARPSAAVRHADRRGAGVAVLATRHGSSRRAANGQMLTNTSRMDGITIDTVGRWA
jgi:hypothetical protein